MISPSKAPLTDQDGVFQEPARRWVFTRGNDRIEHNNIGANSLAEAYGEKVQPARENR